MSIAIVTGSGGLVGSEAVRRAVAAGYDVIGVENDMRARFFGRDASTAAVTDALVSELDEFRSLDADVRDRERIDSIFAEHGAEIELIVHAAAQPSHDWAAREPHTDFGVNALGTLNLLEATRARCPEASFVFLSTNKVYGDLANSLPLIELETRLELPADHPYHAGIDTSMSIDRSTHSLFGVSKAAADLLVQEYGRYFELPTVCLRCGCISGPSHAGAMLHGFLAYLMRCTVTGDPYTVLGHGGKQVRDNIHAADLAEACLAFHARPRAGAVYNLGGGRESSCSMLEAIEACERISGSRLDWKLSDEARIGDHRWWISDLDEFRADYPEWRLTRDVEVILRELHAENAERWLAAAAS
ncbi:MAG: NAD-dependent epimerase/dehydratase family protein [Solirubrobacterales bacterium]|nr:NAD-dependent epimerase/dehydratase family protein [Solirubrobacterales bacterium]